MRLNAKLNELGKLNANARQALVMAADAQKAGDAAKATQYTRAAETIANQLIQVEKDVEGLKQMVLDSTNAADQAKAAVAQNGRLLQQKLAEKNRLLSQLDQAKMQEELNAAMGAAERDRRRRRADAQRGAAEDRGPLRQGEGRQRAQRGQRAGQHPRDRAGDDEHRGAEPAQPAARRARPRRRHHAAAAVAAGSAGAISAAPADAGSVPVTEDQPAAQPNT